MRSKKLATLSALLAATLAISACGSGGTTGDAGVDGGSAGTPVKDGTLKLAGTSLGVDLDPYRQPSLTWQGIWPIYDALFRLGKDLSAQPGLATAHQYTPDGLSLTLTLRSGVTFQDGTPFDGAAVKASLDRGRGATMPKSAVAGLLRSVTAVTVVDPISVRLDLSRPDASLPLVLAGLAGMMINPKMVGDDAAIAQGTPGVGTGAYRVTRFVPQQTVVYERWDGYWEKEIMDTAPKVFQFDRVLDRAARAAGFLAGQYDAVTTSGIRSQLTAAAGKDPKVKITDSNSYIVPTLMFNTSIPPFDNVDARRALAHAINVSTIVPNVLTEAMDCAPEPLNQLFVAGSWPNDPDVKVAPYDPDLAKSFLQKAGQPSGFTFRLVTPANLGGNTAAAAFQADLDKVGVKMTIDTPDGPTSLAQFQADAAPAYITTMFSSSADPSGLINDKVLTLGLIPDTAEGQAAKEAARKAQETQDQAQRATYYHEFSRIVADQVFMIPFCSLNVGLGHTSTIGGLENSPYLNYGHIDPRTVVITK